MNQPILRTAKDFKDYSTLDSFVLELGKAVFFAKETSLKFIVFTGNTFSETNKPSNKTNVLFKLI